jgi:hypothetical protein
MWQSNRMLFLAGAVCLVVGGVPTLLASYAVQRDAMYGIFMIVTLPLTCIGAALVLLAGMRALFHRAGFSAMIATSSAGLVAIGQYFVAGSGYSMWSVIFAFCGAALVLFSGLSWLQSLGDRRR